MNCKYEGCKRDVFENSGKCILHMNVPYKKEPEFDRINRLKTEEIEKKMKGGDLDFKGVKLYELSHSGLKTKGNPIFTRSVIINDVKLDKSSISGDISFDRAQIGGNVDFESAEINGNVSFYGATVEGDIWFDGSDISKYSWFEKSIIGGKTSFNYVYIGGSVSFQNSMLNEDLSFHDSKIRGNAWFDSAQIGGNAWLNFLQIKGELSFKDTLFKDPRGQEKCCRKAKSIWEKIGDRDKADYYFYREMEAKRKQKLLLIRYLEIVVQYTFGYGVYPYRLLFSFTVVFLLFAFIYWALEGKFDGNSLISYLRFSFLTMVIPAYGVINAKTGVLGLLTIIEAIIGAFTWPAFLVMFARKYMR